MYGAPVIAIELGNPRLLENVEPKMPKPKRGKKRPAASS